MKDAQYQVEVALRLALVGKDRGPALKSAFSDFTKWMNHYSDVDNQQMRIPRIEVDEWFDRVNAVLHYVGLYLPNVRTGWQTRTGLIFENHTAISKADASDVVETLCHLGNEKIMSGDSWCSKPVLEGVRLLLLRLWVVAWKLVALRVPQSPYWAVDKPDGDWTESARNADFGYVEVLRAINNPDFSWTVPTDPHGANEEPHYIGYWFSLAAVLVGHLGWRQPSTGLARWFNKEMQDDDAVLNEIKRMWGPYGASLMTEIGRDILMNMAHQILGESESSKNQVSTFEAELSPEKLQLQHSIETKLATDKKWAAPIVGGLDPLHLTTHVVSVLGTALCSSEMDLDKVSILHDDPSSTNARATLVVDRGTPWYAALKRAGDRLPQRPDGRSWRVDVVSKDFGYIGEFRKSRVTGLWFAGKHSSHLLGNPD